MQVIRITRGPRRGATLSIVAQLALGLVLLAAAVGAAWVAFRGGLLDGLDRLGNSVVEQLLLGTLAWALAILVPGVLALLGVVTLVRALDRGPRGPVRPAIAVAAIVPQDYVLVQDVHLPDGRHVPEIVLGAHGLTVVEQLPPARASRPGSHHWEVCDRAGRWRTVENPLDRAARDGERLRSWLGSQLEDFVPRVSVAVVSDDDRVTRTAEVAVLRADQLPDFLAAQPALRQMSPERRGRIEALLRERLDA